MSPTRRAVYGRPRNGILSGERARERYGFDPENEGDLVGAEKLGTQEGTLGHRVGALRRGTRSLPEPSRSPPPRQACP